MRLRAVRLPAFFFLTAFLSAQVIVSESFEYTSGDVLVGQTGGVGFTTPWQGMAASSYITATGQAYGNLSQTGNAVGFHNNNASRQFTPLALAEGPIWFSFLISPQAPTQNSSSVSGGIHLGEGANPLQGVFVGFSAGAWAVGSSPENANWLDYSGFPAVTLNQSYLLVGRIDVDKTGHFWINPALEDTPLDSTAIDPNGALLAFMPDAISGILIGGNDAIIDEIRLGSSFAAVAPIPEVPASAAMVGVATLGMVLFRRRGSREDR